MFNRAKIKTCFEGIVGWRDSQNVDCIPALDTYNKTSNSGIYFDGNAGPRIETVYACMSKDYTADETGFNIYLKNLYEDSEQEVIRKYIALQQKRLNGKAILSNQELGYRPEGNIRTTVAKRSRFVGIEFTPFEAKNYATELLYLGLWLKEAQTLKIYIYSSDKIEPLTNKDLEYTEAGSLQLFSFNEILSYNKRFITEGGSYYIGYYEDDLSVTQRAIDTRKPCGGCGGSPVKKYMPYIKVRPFTVALGNTYIDKTLFDIDAIGYTDQTFGLTANINVTCDLSNLFCENKDSFAAALQKQVQITSYWQIYNTKELGPQAELSKEDARLNADRLELALDDELKNIILDFENASCDCIGSKRGSLSIIGL